MGEKNQKIKCNVESCMFQNNNYCQLKEIQVDNCESHDANTIKETACKSFKFDKIDNN